MNRISDSNGLTQTLIEWGISKMYLLLFTIVYIVTTHILNLGDLLALGIYIIGLSIIKGLLSEELENVFNIKRTKFLYSYNGFKNSLMELLSLIIVFINFYLIDYVPFSFLEFIYLFFVITVLYRFLFWGITRTIRNRVYIKGA
ncbi:hypothetical protein [Aquisalibacillus elongatus]|uniref:Uncharacterized protein n=1 Tax=Aquisalibacillus elongatus TaxID=485577 RepID=A0A3N5C9X4_9BACI|nr:hypothetical protein [Aquisalibacillus elongatus]RPF53501.1 hypothetical protein EDC24_2011 [Aquisalibacillus elongatus]